MKINVGYGRGCISLDIPPKNVAEVTKPKIRKALSPKTAFKKALDRPIGRKLEDLSNGKRVCLLIEDATRPSPHSELLDCVIPRLKGADEVTVIISTGTHDAKTKGNVQIANLAKNECRKCGLKKFEVLIHDNKKARFTYLGKTMYDTPVYVNEKVIGFDLYVATSNLKPHYFAGYSNPTKNFLPGVASFKTTEKNHSLTTDPRSTFGVHPMHPKRKENPVAIDIAHAVKMIAKNTYIFALCFVKSDKGVIWARSGEMKKVLGEGLVKVDETANYKVNPAKYVIVSPGRFPNDESLYISQRALELTRNAMVDGAEVLFISKCENKIAPNERAVKYFYNKLKKPLEAILAENRGQYKLYSHKARKFALLLDRIKKLWVYTSLNDKIVEDIHMHVAKSPQAVVNGWLRNDPKAKILVLDNANMKSVY